MGEKRHADALRGDFRQTAGGANGDKDSWATLIHAERAVALGEPIDMSSLNDGGDAGAGSERLALFRQRYALVQMSDLAAPTIAEPTSPAESVAMIIAHSWWALGAGEAVGELEACAKEARRLGYADLVVESHALIALDALRSGDRSAAVRQARLASRMARTESIPSAEYLAGIVLARTRRASGFPHLAAQILHALSSTAPAIWQRWIRWELALSGASLKASDDAHDPASALIDACAASSAGSLPELRAHLATCRKRVADVALFGADVDAVAGALLSGTDVDSSAAASDASTAATPFAALIGEGYVVCQPGEGVSIRRAALALWPFKVLESAAAKQKRSATLVSVLALAGGQLEEAECFAQVYGFAFAQQMHRGSFDVLLHRVRGWLEGRATLERDGDRIRLDVLQPFIVRDPREGESVEARILRIVANGSGTARAAAAATGLSVRQAQSILKVLAEDGACVAERRGPGLHYRVEDTTFSEPTRV